MLVSKRFITFVTQINRKTMNTNKENNKKHYYCLILAGGKGRRLWPVSREEKPKQFIDFFGTGMTLLQQTYERFCHIVPEENIYVATYSDYQDLVLSQLPQLTGNRLLREPVRRNTAPIVAWATHRIVMSDPNAAIIVTPSDQIIMNEDVYRNDILNALSYVYLNNCLLTLGLRPTRPEPGYGYIQMGESMGEGEANTDFYKVQSFTEKPEREFAEMFMKSGEFLWNTGLFLFTPEAIRENFYTVLPSVMRSLDAEKKDATWLEEERWVEQYYSTYPNISLEAGILEHSDKVRVKECHFGWADIGAWHGIYEAYATSREDNVALDTDTMLTDTTGCVISLPKGRTAIINGLHDFIVAEHDDILLITPRCDSSNQVVKLLNRYNTK